MTEKFALSGAAVFDGSQRHDGLAVIIDAGRIAGLARHADIPAETPLVDLSGGLLTAGFIDTQVNGGGGVLFNDRPTVDGIRTIVETHTRFGTTSLLPTLITDTPEITLAALSAARAAASGAAPGCLGIHLEGPFLAPTRKGAHDPTLIRAMTQMDIAALSNADLAPILLTVAAETVPPDTIRHLSDQGIIVSIGHSDADFDTTMAAFAAGARGVTHLFNAMSPLSHRAPGVVGAALDAGDVWCGVIADGFHVHPAAIRAALGAKRPPGRLMLVTDAMPTVGVEEDTFTLNGRQVRRQNGRLTLDDGVLAGSDLTMIGAVRFMVEQVGVDVGEALRMASLYPASFLGLEDRKGSIAPGCDADLVHLSDSLDILGVWRGGQRVIDHPPRQDRA